MKNLLLILFILVSNCTFSQIKNKPEYNYKKDDKEIGLLFLVPSQKCIEKMQNQKCRLASDRTYLPIELALTDDSLIQNPNLNRKMVLNLFYSLLAYDSSYYKYLTFNTKKEYESLNKKNILIIAIDDYKIKRHPSAIISFISLLLIPGFYDKEYVVNAVYYDDNGKKIELNPSKKVYFRQWMGFVFFIWGTLLKDSEKDHIFYLLENINQEVLKIKSSI